MRLATPMGSLWQRSTCLPITKGIPRRLPEDSYCIELVDNLLNTIANGDCHEVLEGMVAVVPMAQVGRAG